MKEISKIQSNDRENGPRGRGRGNDKTSGERLQEDRAKGHLHPHPPDPALAPTGNDEPREAELERGHQKGFGKNQQQEGNERNSKHGTRSNGADGAASNAGPAGL